MAISPAKTSLDVFTTSTEEEQRYANITDVETVITFSSEIKSCLIYNDGPNAVHFSTSSGVTITNFMIPALDALSIVFPVISLYFICAAGQICTLYLIGER